MNFFLKRNSVGNPILTEMSLLWMSRDKRASGEPGDMPSPVTEGRRQEDSKIKVGLGCKMSSRPA